MVWTSAEIGQERLQISALRLWLLLLLQGSILMSFMLAKFSLKRCKWYELEFDLIPLVNRDVLLIFRFDR
jgi:hypothetical protein